MEGTAVLVYGIGGTGKASRAREVIGDRPTTALLATALDADRPLGVFDHLLDPEQGTPAAADVLVAALDDTTLLVEHIHHADPRSIEVIDHLIRRGVPVVVTARPTDRADLEQLRVRFAASGEVIETGPLPEDELGAALAVAAGRAIDSDELARLHEGSGGILRWALPLLDGGPVGPAVDSELAGLDEAVRRVAGVLALAPGAPDQVLAEAAGLDLDAFVAASRDLHRAGLQDERHGALVPVVAEALATDVVGVEHRALQRRIATALLTQGTEPTAAADHLRAAEIVEADAADIYRRAGDDQRFRDPLAALEWYALASRAGGDEPATLAGIAEAALFAGIDRPVVDSHGATWSTELRARALAVEAATAARAGRTARAAELLSGLEDHPMIARDLADALATPGAWATGDPPSSARDEEATVGARWVRRLSGAVVAARPPFTEEFLEACELFERWEPTFVPHDTPHAIAALTFLGGSDLRAAQIVLDRAERSEAGGPGFAVRRRLLTAWIHMRQTRYELPGHVLETTSSESLGGRDRLVLAALESGIARRSGDVPRMRAAWSTAEPVLVAGIGDLFHHELLAELLLVAVRLRDEDRAGVLLGTMRGWVDAVGDAHPWRVPQAWLEVLVAVEADDTDGLSGAVADLAAIAGSGERDRVLVEAARLWLAASTGDDVDIDQVVSVAEALAQVDLAWEGSRLAGRIALDRSDAGESRRLLETARRLHRSPVADDAAPSVVGLTDREVELAHYLVDGHTYKEIGAAMYISPKTVEHHVARIRRKLQAESRAQMLAALREQLDAD